MEKNSILIVDDEKNIRMTMFQSLESPGTEIRTAVNGEEAIHMISENKELQCGLVFLDLKLPGIDGIAVLRRIRESWPEIRVIVITAHGSIDSAVEAMKLGAVDFIRKPFTPDEIRSLANQIFERKKPDENDAADYMTLIGLTRDHIKNGRFDDAGITSQKAVATDPGKPEAYNLIGVLIEVKGDRLDAQKMYRAALDIDPAYKPAQANLDRVTSWGKFGRIDIGTERDEPMIDGENNDGNLNEK